MVSWRSCTRKTYFISQISSEPEVVGYIQYGYLLELYSLNMAILGFFSLIMWRRGPHFFPQKKNSLCTFRTLLLFFLLARLRKFAFKKKKTLERESREKNDGNKILM